MVVEVLRFGEETQEVLVGDLVLCALVTGSVEEFVDGDAESASEPLGDLE